MNEAKLRKVVSAIVTGACLLIFFLVGILINQLIGIRQKKQELEWLESGITEIQIEINKTEQKTENWIEWWKEQQIPETLPE